MSALSIVALLLMSYSASANDLPSSTLDVRYLRLQGNFIRNLTSHININTFSTGYQIHAVLLEKSKSSFGGACWKRSLNELESDCKSQKDKLIIWVFVTCKKVIILILLILETKRLAFAEL